MFISFLVGSLASQTSIYAAYASEMSYRRERALRTEKELIEMIKVAEAEFEEFRGQK